MKNKLLIMIFTCLFVTGCIISFGGAKTGDAGMVRASGTDPLFLKKYSIKIYVKNSSSELYRDLHRY